MFSGVRLRDVVVAVVLVHGFTVQASTYPYDTFVAAVVSGVVSRQPGLILGEGSEKKEMIATPGRVRVEVDATRSASKPATSSSRATSRASR